MKPSRINSALLLLLVVSFWLISTYCQISLFTSFVATGRDQWHAGIFAAALVATQYLFIDQAAKKWWAGQPILAGTSTLAVGVLMAISVSCTALYFESRYQTLHSAATVGSDGYNMLHNLITEKQQSAAAYKTLAATETERGNKWVAGQHLKNAAQIEADLPHLLDRLTQQQPTGSTVAVVASTGNARWALWWCFALVADLIPAVAILLLRSNTAVTAPVVAKTVAEQPKKQPAECSKTAEQTLSIKSLIVVMGRMPSWREANAKGMTYSTYKRQIEELQTAGVIERDGQVFRVLKEVTQ